MNIQSDISTPLWEVISTQYQQGNYTKAIIDAINYLRDIFRDLSNLDCDSAPLVGQSLGGDIPLIKINDLETDSKKDQQKGFEQLVRGLFQCIRNPRIHAKFEDDIKEADEIILFIYYYASILMKSKPKYSLNEWSNRVFDEDFVESPRYVDLLVEEVPPKKILEALI